MKSHFMPGNSSKNRVFIKRKKNQKTISERREIIHEMTNTRVVNGLGIHAEKPGTFIRSRL